MRQLKAIRTGVALSKSDAIGEQDMGATTYFRVHKAIVADIVSGHFAPGARLKIAELCDRYGLSPMPIREALQQLQGEGLVVMVPNKGASVRALDRQFLNDIYEIREALCAIYYRHAVEKDDAKLDDGLSSIQRQFDEAMQAGDVERCNQENRNFHREIEARCRNEEAVKLGRKYRSLTGSLRDLFGFKSDRLSKISSEHWNIVEAIKARDVPASIEAAQKHLRSARQSMLENFD